MRDTSKAERNQKCERRFGAVGGGAKRVETEYWYTRSGSNMLDALSAGRERLVQIDTQLPMLLRRHRLLHNAVLLIFAAIAVLVLSVIAIGVAVSPVPIIAVILILVFVFIPYWVDIIVRTFSWLILLGDNGLINKALGGLGIHPLQMLYTPFSVLIAMVQILLPLTTVILFGAMLRIDRALVAAAKIHGANGWQAFRTVFFPLSLPGVYGAGLLAFVLSLGFYVTPALLGSPRETMIAQTIMVEASQLLDWEQASAAGFVLLVITTLIAWIYNRYFSLDRLWGGSET